MRRDKASVRDAGRAQACKVELKVESKDRGHQTTN